MKVLLWFAAPAAVAMGLWLTLGASCLPTGTLADLGECQAAICEKETDLGKPVVDGRA
jgi:hypothetical protein